MRLSILAFACGIALLQVQGELPGAGVMGGLCALALPGFFLCARRQHWVFRIVAVVCCTLLGFVWAGWMAQQRLADQLPTAWEAREIEIIGVIASLPQRFERGERFEFDVESVLTKGAKVPGRIMLSWYRSLEGSGESSETTAMASIIRAPMCSNVTRPAANGAPIRTVRSALPSPARPRYRRGAGKGGATGMASDARLQLGDKGFLNRVFESTAKPRSSQRSRKGKRNAAFFTLLCAAFLFIFASLRWVLDFFNASNRRQDP